MNITTEPSIVLTIIIIISVLFVIIIVIVVAVMVHRLNTRFAKLGYVAREDAKKYFGDAAEKVVDMNSGFYEQYQTVIDSSVRKVLSDSGTIMAQTLGDAERRAGEVILKAQEDAKQITASAQAETEEYYERALSRSVDAIEWALEQYIHDSLDVRQHEDIVKNLVDTYVNERRN
ncbi:MAG TPA: hypothetical protein PKD68_03530 [Candidatus Saccharibacteria bacterium]|nr:hypothetical protein [Candidatus Saccharibacteria bacterium]